MFPGRPIDLHGNGDTFTCRTPETVGLTGIFYFKVTLGLNVFNIFDWREPWGVWPLTGLAEDPGEYYMKEVKNQGDGGTLSGSYYDMPWRYSSPREINFFIRFDFN